MESGHGNSSWEVLLGKVCEECVHDVYKQEVHWISESKVKKKSHNTFICVQVFFFQFGAL